MNSPEDIIGVSVDPEPLSKDEAKAIFAEADRAKEGVVTEDHPAEKEIEFAENPIVLPKGTGLWKKDDAGGDYANGAFEPGSLTTNRDQKPEPPESDESVLIRNAGSLGAEDISSRVADPEPSKAESKKVEGNEPLPEPPRVEPERAETSEPSPEEPPKTSQPSMRSRIMEAASGGIDGIKKFAVGIGVAAKFVFFKSGVPELVAGTYKKIADSDIVQGAVDRCRIFSNKMNASFLEEYAVEAQKIVGREKAKLTTNEAIIASRRSDLERLERVSSELGVPVSEVDKAKIVLDIEAKSREIEASRRQISEYESAEFHLRDQQSIFMERARESGGRIASRIGEKISLNEQHLGDLDYLIGEAESRLKPNLEILSNLNNNFMVWGNISLATKSETWRQTAITETRVIQQRITRLEEVIKADAKLKSKLEKRRASLTLKTATLKDKVTALTGKKADPQKKTSEPAPAAKKEEAKKVPEGPFYSGAPIPDFHPNKPELDAEAPKAPEATADQEKENSKEKLVEKAKIGDCLNVWNEMYKKTPLKAGEQYLKDSKEYGFEEMKKILAGLVFANNYTISGKPLEQFIETALERIYKKP